MKKIPLITSAIVSLLSTTASAEEPWTDLGFYLFATGISGDVQLRNVPADVDASFSDILDNLDSGFMGYIEHRRDKWSFIGELAYLAVSDEQTSIINPGPGPGLEINAEVELSQAIISGYAGYRVLDKDYDESNLGVDILFGARHTTLDMEFRLAQAIGDFSGSRSADREEDWVDAVIAARFQSDYNNGWGSMVWLDLGDGSDSSSYQLMAMASYQSSDNWRFYGGYRFLNLEYETGSGTSTFAVDLDYSGPMFGASYRL